MYDMSGRGALSRRMLEAQAEMAGNTPRRRPMETRQDGMVARNLAGSGLFGL
jgi:hypothetical protein